jgi:DNA-binding CsgD family transcriptional regulator
MRWNKIIRLKPLDILFRDKVSGHQSIVEKQRRAAFIYACMALFIADVALWFLGMSIYGVALYEVIHPAHFVLTLTLLVLYLRGAMTVFTGITVLCVANQLSVVFELLLALLGDDTPFQIGLIMGYMAMAGFNMTLVLLVYIRVLPFVLGALALAAYGFCCWVIRDGTLFGMLPVFVACFTVVSLLGQRLSSNVHQLEKEKELLKEDEQQILSLFGMSKKKLNAYIMMSKRRGMPLDEIAMMLDIIGLEAREVIRENVSYYYRQREIDYANLRVRLPMMTPSEIEICNLILEEKKLKDILRILGKTEGNVTSQRANIRRKLGLSPSESLRDALVGMVGRREP